MTTDPFPKEAAIEASAGGRSFRVGGMAKGSGMIEPLMATMLGVVTTDAAVAPALLNRALKAAVDETFNAITVDGECSTNDCVFVLANGASGVELTELDFPLLVASLRAACEPLAVGIVRGGEGATKLVTVRVTGARSDQEARRAARAIANSLLVKTAVHGGRSELGTPHRRRRALGNGVHAREGRRPDRPDDALRGRDTVRRPRASSGRLPAGAGYRSRGRSRDRRTGSVADVDV